MKKQLYLLFMAIMSVICGQLFANNIHVSNVALTGKNTTDHYVLVQFDLTWENSWRTATIPLNWDAAWVFVKYRVTAENGGDGVWRHALLNNSGHATSTGTQAIIETGLLNPLAGFDATTNPVLGSFVFRKDFGSGNFSQTGMTLQWNYGANGMADTDYFDIRVYAVEMVYVPAGSFAAGSDGTETDAFTLTTISTADVTQIPSGTGVLGGHTGGYPTGQTAPPSMSWPNGYNSFYSMKYETSQQQYVDFLNTLTYTQQETRIAASPSSAAGTFAFAEANRSGIKILTPGVASTTPAVFTTTSSDVSCGFLKYTDGAAYADWAGLRPMTEMEFEKAARGISSPVANEYPWGTTTIAGNTYSLSNTDAADEDIASNYNTTDGNALYSLTGGTIAGPVRVGIFSANAGNTGRTTAGASFWGILELGGNLTEHVVTMANSAGRNFTGKHGNGTLTADGFADVPNWPGLTGGAVTDSAGAGDRGGSFVTAADLLRTSDRSAAASAFNKRRGYDGFRAVRSIPFVCGSDFTANHIAGAVAPVDKVVSYGTVTNIPGETDKCWITKNLGADQQATSRIDPTEASAGWYWQFNRKQGYKHDGSTLTPSWTITSINENINWQQINDPCSIELGSAWRIPTYSEWINVINAGLLNNPNGIYNSGLKMHQAGYLRESDGLLRSRGTIAYYWSSSQRYDSHGYLLYFFGNSLGGQWLSKAQAFPLRCMRSIQPEITTTVASAINDTDAISGGSIISDGSHDITARGVCWSTSTGPTTALTTTTADGAGSGTFISRLTGLTANTLYYVRAYAVTTAGTVYGNEITFTTALPFACGTSALNINHYTNGNVAPVNKSVSYETVTNIPGEISKCWITKNLGADQQATAVDDATEASAGWYWQFNLKQGYKHDGTTRTPNTTWTTAISENSGWISSNDPCTIELGSNWRIPTATEWTNVDGSSGGDWTTWNGPWSSALKIHAAGYIWTNGLFYHRGTYGDYWSSTQSGLTDASLLNLGVGACSVQAYAKSHAFNLRCLRTWQPDVTTTSASAISTDTAVSGGSVTLNAALTVTARGVCWSTTTGPTIALTTKTVNGTGDGTFSSNLTGLTPSTLYYVRAYASTSAGTVYGNEISFTTAAPPFNCGTSTLTVNHTTTGGVAPVNKNTTYGTVTNIPGETSKCWITKNLGATQQATAVDDNTEASAGWYWKFNRKQGYKHDGTTATPAWTYTTINEVSNWLSANDPCTIELGSVWRIPTNTEWNNADIAGGWNNGSDAYASLLKLHYAGMIFFTDGTMYLRNAYGVYCSSTQANSTNVNDLHFNPSISTVYGGHQKMYGFSLRCIRTWQPDVTTTSASAISTDTAVSGGTITLNAALTVTARGVCWSTTTGPTIALTTKTVNGTGDGAFSSNLTGLTPSTLYYVRAYATTSAGTVYGNEISFTTAAPPFTCGTSTLTVNHTTSGGVAPVDKNTTYETVTNIPGETSKCWITKNLGADQQATAVDDATEASAGWYWQFNRKQGYKHDGATRTPNTTWMNPIIENSDWTSANDPCTIELGDTWRIPTYSEWTNVNGTSGGNWTNRTGPWNSNLKLHCAGDLNNINGEVRSQGVSGDYWTSTQDAVLGNAWQMGFNSGYSNTSNNGKSSGLTLRCLRTWQPDVTTASASAISTDTAVSGGTITLNAALTVTARGVCWSTTTGPTIALTTKTVNGTGDGAFSSNLTGLTPSTLYYVRAYASTSAGTVYGNEISFTTAAPPFTCGTSTLTVNHTTSGGVAPVDKNTTYETVTNIPGETSKCWITKNLGADQQATAVDDATEASAGWYWQFNRKQGYKHDGATRTPNTTWMNPIIENSDWTSANDPCTIELGDTWRIPTYSEWTNVNGTSGGNWTNRTGPWNSNLKLHCAGDLNNINGEVRSQGVSGDYWTSTQDAVLGNAWQMGFNSGYSNTSNNGKSSGLTLRCLRTWQPDVTTTSASAISTDTAVSGGSVTLNAALTVTARGVCWSTTTGPTIALTTKTVNGTGDGTFSSNLTGLTPSTLYYVRAYASTSAGTVYGNEISFTTAAPPFNCGTSTLTVNHTTTGGVAPVNKNTTYGTVTNIPGETSKCWITKNLGADQQATAVDDATEASAGWYWQFNRKQGYKHDGSTRTPNATWIYPIYENSDWLSDNDPCTLELGASWRIPTITEWKNIYGPSGGNWTDWNGPWNSNLKLHASGYLYNSSGSLETRGIYGGYWGSTQGNDDYSQNWGLGSSYCSVDYYTKTYGFSIRCLRD